MAGLWVGALLILLDGPLVHAAGEVQDLAARRRLARIDVPNEDDIQVFPARPRRLSRGWHAPPRLLHSATADAGEQRTHVLWGEQVHTEPHQAASSATVQRTEQQAQVRSLA